MHCSFIFLWFISKNAQFSQTNLLFHRFHWIDFVLWFLYSLNGFISFHVLFIRLNCSFSLSWNYSQPYIYFTMICLEKCSICTKLLPFWSKSLCGFIFLAFSPINAQFVLWALCSHQFDWIHSCCNGFFILINS